MDAQNQNSQTVQRLQQFRTDLDSFCKWIENRNESIKFEDGTLKCCRISLDSLGAKVDDMVSNSIFGARIFLDEVDDLLDDFDSIFVDSNITAEKLNESLNKLGLELYHTNLLKINRYGSNDTIVYLGKANTRIESFDELEMYYSVGTALKDDPSTLLLLDELRKLHTDYPEISLFSATIGPNYLGKTQVAFTLANIVNVIYVDLSSRRSDNITSINSLFCELAGHFRSVLSNDESKKSKKAYFGETAQELLNSTRPFQTLGLIYILMRTRKLCSDLDGLEWLKEIVNINRAMILPMTIKEFISKTKDIDFENQVMFIDFNWYYDSLIRFLRNLCRAIRLPTHITGTQSSISKLYCPQDLADVGAAWVQMIVKTPNFSIDSICKFIKFKPHNSEIASSCLKDFMEPGSKTLLYEQLFMEISGSADMNLLNPIKKLIEFLLNQCEGCLPGIIILIFSKLFEMLPKFTDSKTFWSDLATTFITDVMTRKSKCFMQTREFLFKNAQIATFARLPKGKEAASRVENNLFRYGLKDERTFLLHVGSERDSSRDDPSFLRNGKRYDEECHFPGINEDFFTSFVTVGMWNLIAVKNERNSGIRSCTLAYMYECYVKPSFFDCFSSSNDINTSALEVIVYWSIHQASHLNLNGETRGIEVLSEFAKNLQSINGHCTMKGLSTLPDSFEAVLNRIKVPYLMRFPADEAERIKTQNDLEKSLCDFAQFGRTHFHKSRNQYSLAFDMKFDGLSCNGFIEFKISIAYPSFYRYYKKACYDQNPLSLITFVIVNKTVSSLNLEEIAEPSKTRTKLSTHEPSEKIAKLSSHEQAKKTAIKNHYLDSFQDLWKDPKNHINIYLIHYKKIPKSAEGQFTISTLKSFPNPKGVFILLETNFDNKNFNHHHC